MLQQETFLITGGNGFLASRLLDQLLLDNNDRKIIVVSRSRGKAIRKYHSKIHYVYGNLKEKHTWTALPRTVTHVFHMAAFIPWRAEDKNAASVAEENLLPIAQMIECCQSWPDLKHVVFSSSVSVYAKSGLQINEESEKAPADLYGASKLAGENLLHCLRSREIVVTSLRYSSIYGLGQYQGTVLPVMISRALQHNEILVYGTGERVQDFVYCTDAANANWLAYKTRAAGAFNIGSGVPVSMKVLASTINHVFSNDRANIVFMKTDEAQEKGFTLDISKASNALGYMPEITLEDGLKRLKQEMGV